MVRSRLGFFCFFGVLYQKVKLKGTFPRAPLPLASESAFLSWPAPTCTRTRIIKVQNTPVHLTETHPAAAPISHLSASGTHISVTSHSCVGFHQSSPPPALCQKDDRVLTINKSEKPKRRHGVGELLDGPTCELYLRGKV